MVTEVIQNQWLFVGIYAAIAFIVPTAAILIAALLSPRQPNYYKTLTYECGLETFGETWVQFKAQYYTFALIYLIFDVETIFLYPWAVAYRQLPFFAVLEALLFILMLLGGLLYAWRKRELEWL